MRPIILPANQPRHFYRGGENIARFREVQPADDHRPEDWVGSTTTRFGADKAGLTRLPAGGLLRAAIAAEPEAWLGPEHVRRWGADPALLVKLLDAGQRLPMHCHPSREFARAHLDSAFGKTEAWLVLDTPGHDEGVVYLGFRDEVPAERLREWSVTQDHAEILAAAHAVPVRAGDAVLVPAGLPHAIGAGLFLVELQEPTDFSVLLEWAGFAPDGDDRGHLRLGWDAALRCVDRRGWSREEVAELVRPRGAMQEGGPGPRRVLPVAAEPYFGAELAGRGAELPAGFAVLVALRGAGDLEYRGGRLPLRAGMTALVPYGAGAMTLRGEVEVLRCLPPTTGGEDDHAAA